ncbi:MAG: hypothetical protein ACI86M_003008 [Saprospiraceae bacterium]|jgi:uncharacterized protein (TIGR00297 family)
MLTKYGWITAITIALLIIASGLNVYLIYPVSFLILGSLASKMNLKNEDNKGRTVAQVLANSGVAGILVIIYLMTQNEFLLIAFVISFSVALSDTFSSEIGKRFGKIPISICTLKPIQRGLSGGISLTGTLGGVFGSLCISTIYYSHKYDLQNTAIVFVLGIIGMLIDSVIGCSIQAKFSNGQIVTETGKRDNLIKGYFIIDNNMTNFLSILITILIYLTFL